MNKNISLLNNDMFNTFQEQYLISFDANSLNTSIYKETISKYKKIFTLLSKSTFKSESILKAFDQLTDHKITLKLPYVIFINEVNYLQHIIFKTLIDSNAHDSLIVYLRLFNDINNLIAKKYLDDYITAVISINNMRVTSMAEIIKQNVVIHYKQHLEWLSNLAICIKNKNKENFPQLNCHKCNFGHWLETEGKSIIHNNSKYKAIYQLHENLHMFGEKIYNKLDSEDYHAFLTYLEKCELISLNIGTELALIDNILMNKQITKDSLTKALNRHALEQVFESQYEIALATSNSFIFAMCDLDYFKKINDTYGHLAGDKMLIEFVKIVKSQIRNSDIIIRYGGEEFVLILPAIDKTRGLKILTDIKEEFNNFILEYESYKISTTVSIGMSEITPEYYFSKNMLEEYLSIVDKKLYNAKNNGRNQIYI